MLELSTLGDLGLNVAMSSRTTYFSVYEELRMPLMVMVGCRYVGCCGYYVCAL